VRRSVEIGKDSLMKGWLIFVFIFLFSLAEAQTSLKFSRNALQSSDKDTVLEKKSGSTAKYILYSLILPGTGQWSIGEKDRAKFFLGTEFLLWVGYFGTSAYANIIRDNYRGFATLHAEVNSDNKKEQYWIDIGSSDNIYQFNEQRLRERNIAATYPENEENFWQWDSRESLKKYNGMRVKEHDWEQRATFIVGAFVLNRLISVVDVIRLIRKQNSTSRTKHSNLYFDYKRGQAGSGYFRLNFKLRW
jgi:hypothetical protein